MMHSWRKNAPFPRTVRQSALGGECLHKVKCVYARIAHTELGLSSVIAPSILHDQAYHVGDIDAK